MRSQLEMDLMRNASDRLTQWRKDTVMRCEVADLPMKQQISLVYTCLTGELVRITEMLGVSDEDFATLMQFALRDWKQKKRDLKGGQREDHQT